MDSQRSFSETETCLFNKISGAVHATSENQKNLLKSFICGESISEWTQLVAMMESNGPLSILSEDELKYLNALNATSRGHQSSQAQGGVGIFSKIQPIPGQKTTDHNLVKAATKDMVQYNDVLEKLLVKYRDYVRSSISGLQTYAKTDNGASVFEQKIAQLSSRRDSLKKEIHSLENKINNRFDRLEDTSRTEPNIAESEGGLSDRSSKSIALTEVFKTTLPSYDHILSRLSALHGELNYDVGEDDTILQTARRHATQIVLSLATKCRASLDTVFLEASLTYNRRASYASNYARDINDEREAVYAEIQSLWDEMVPLSHMVVENEFLKPILKKTETRSDRQGTRDMIVSSYTSAMLRFMNERLRILVSRIQMLVYHHQTLLNAFTIVNSKTGARSTKGLGTANMHRAQTKEGGKSKGHTLMNTIRRQMELYGSVPIDVDKMSQTAPTPTSHMQVDKLDRYVTSRQKKGDDIARNVHSYFERAAKSQITDAEFGAHLLLDSVIADSTAGSRVGGHVYDDQQVEDSVATIKSQTNEIETTFRKLREGAGTPSSASDFVTYAYNKSVKQVPSDDSEKCPKFAAIVQKWGDSAGFTN
ncbi:uncharacterized protein GGS22DRAFT_191781 [Annulohypoxylon maeteangense]|uniref:uncharacterized protein n=1 Tax=Annulohypoxylon maeteangense TaxID=1927788 RepID=UPI002007D337|nr:uncharacterized protein GGS22DRAFT_191781 [Annulohypoxylon maeteangense]KAI0882050.1 hypothetical protein GGS22DRAFT_191781 [Annulohypoxylon maeteangense]